MLGEVIERFGDAKGKIKIKVKIKVKTKIKIKVKVKGDGQECPSHTGYAEESGLQPDGQPRAAVPT